MTPPTAPARTPKDPPAPAAAGAWVPLVAEWQGLTLSAGDLTRLKRGDVLMLGALCAPQVQLRLSQVPRFVGRPRLRAGKWAVELTGPVIT